MRNLSPDAVSIFWRPGEPSPLPMSSQFQSAVVHGRTVYFSHGSKVYLYAVTDNKWSSLLEVSHVQNFSLAVINDRLTTVGGVYDQDKISDILLSFCESSSRKTWNRLFSSIQSMKLAEISWKESLPRMPNKRSLPAVVSTPTHLVLAGGTLQPSPIDVLNTETLQWCKTAKAPPANDYSRMVSCGGLVYLYLCKKASVYSCSLQDLVTPHSDGEEGIWEMFGLGFPTCPYTAEPTSPL